MKAIAIGRLVPIKNFALPLTAWTNVDIPLEIVGDGPDRFELETLAEALRITDRVHFTGQQDSIAPLLKEADIFIASSHREGFGYVTLEALQSRCVVISTPTGFAAEVIPDKYLVDSIPSVLAETVNWTIDHFDQAKEEFEPVWEYAESLTVSKMANSTRAIYDLLLNAS